MECIICQLHEDEEPIQENTTCPCKYKRHASCWIDYVNSRPVLTCPMCRRTLSKVAVQTTNPYNVIIGVPRELPQIPQPLQAPLISQSQQSQVQTSRQRNILACIIVIALIIFTILILHLA